MSLSKLLKEIRGCRECENHLPLGPRPVLAASQRSRILIIGQAPGKKVHETGIPWNDPSGNRLREWMNLDHDRFYDPNLVAIVPMGFCFPGTGTSGDLPPRKECALLWHDRLLRHLDQVELTLVIGSFAQQWKLGNRRKKTLTETVAAWSEFVPDCLPLPHPSPRNNRWLARHSWFEQEVIPWLQKRVKELL